MNGHCTCGGVSYRLTRSPLFTHACHCTWCQRETGAAFALNAMIETEALELTGAVEEVVTPSASGKGQVIARCPTCRVALYSHYAGAGRLMAFVRVGTLERPGDCPPDVHIFTETKLPWLVLDPAIPSFPEFYQRSKLWPEEALARRADLLARHGVAS
ncbi:GFA family protein [Stagnihabitans tardus]|uniref:Aldehyde-activating protein n=1 Tax=Stagnihabitans tardus TaxID=2699202 RepID=A0AAE4Y701_9RHOB|nr:GFA family protein [Stagnihabitans tardus]NBZ87031.1 aldehyde-activating protein [Stagnihabitans tardus]